MSVNIFKMETYFLIRWEQLDWRLDLLYVLLMHSSLNFSLSNSYLTNRMDNLYNRLKVKLGSGGGQEPGRIGAGGGREAGGDGAGCGSHVKAGEE